MPKATELGMGIVGSGRMGTTYAECLTHYNRGARLVAITGGSRAAGLAERYSVAHEPTLDELVKRRDIDCVIVATPHSRHHAQVVRIARAGKHVLVEKPMATSTADCDDMIFACQRAGVSLGVIQTARYTAPARAAKGMIVEGRIGQVRMLQLSWVESGYLPSAENQWVTEPAEGGAFLDAGVHAFDLLRWLADSEAKQVFGNVTTYGDTALPRLSGMGQVMFTSGAMASVWITYELPKPGFPETTMRTRVVGSTGMLDIDSYGKLQVGNQDGWCVVLERTPYDFARLTDPARLEQFIAQNQDFIDAVGDGRPPPVSGKDGRAAVAMVEACCQSWVAGAPVALR